MHELDTTVPLGLICETQAEFSHWLGSPVEYVILHHKLVRKESCP